MPDTNEDIQGETTSALRLRSPSWLPEAIRSRMTGRRLALVGFALALALSFSVGRGEAFIEAVVMIGIPLFIILKVARSRLRQSNISHTSLRETPRSTMVLTAGRLVAWGVPTFGGGFYGLVATITFVAYQIRELGDADWLQPDAWNGAVTRAYADPFAFLAHDVAMMLWDLLLPISANWIQGLIRAAIWPVYVLSWGGLLGLAGVIILGFAYTRLMPRLWPVVLARIATRNARIRPVSSSETPIVEVTDSDKPRTVKQLPRREQEREE
ncbi:hypothetical protein [Longibacter salinarum]|nr:hypothetical protein [Longibacter salinarum]